MKIKMNRIMKVVGNNDVNTLKLKDSETDFFIYGKDYVNLNINSFVIVESVDNIRTNLLPDSKVLINPVLVSTDILF